MANPIYKKEINSEHANCTNMRFLTFQALTPAITWYSLIQPILEKNMNLVFSINQNVASTRIDIIAWDLCDIIIIVFVPSANKRMENRNSVHGEWHSKRFKTGFNVCKLTVLIWHSYRMPCSDHGSMYRSDLKRRSNYIHYVVVVAPMASHSQQFENRQSENAQSFAFSQLNSMMC